MTGDAYRQVEELVSGIRNAKYDDMVRQKYKLSANTARPENRVGHATGD